MIRVLIADDHPLLRSGLKQILSRESDMAVAGEAQDSEQVLGLIEEQPADVLVLDISMPGRSGLVVLRDIRRRKAGLHVLVLSMHSEEHFAVRAFKAGASGFLTKGSAPGEVIQAIRRIAAGKKYVTATLAETLADSMRSETGRSPHESLSDREFEVMRKLAAGATVSQIAAEISLSVKTISTYRSRVLEKMGLRSNAALTRYAILNGLVE